MEQISFLIEANGRALAEEGAARAAAHADRVSAQQWTEGAKRWLWLIATVGKPFICEEVRSEAERSGFPQPPDNRAWGHVLMGAARAGKIRKTGVYRSGANRVSHHRPQAEWVVVL
jgi:hypothetical protein